MPSRSSSASSVNDVPEMLFEQALTNLQEIVTQLEGGVLTLEETIAAFRHGSELAAHCQRLIADAELRITTLAETDDDELPVAESKHARLQIPGL